MPGEVSPERIGARGTDTQPQTPDPAEGQPLSRWDRLQLARHTDRPHTLDYVHLVVSDFVELKGDRLFGDDQAMIGGLARLEGETVMIVGHQKGRNTKENMIRHFGMPKPEGYRKALRLMQQAEQFGMPVIAFIDTPGAEPGIQSEERGQARAIAHNLMEMSRLKTPTIGIVVGEGGSGGALAIGVTDRTLMLENSVYSVVSPEGCATILWRDSTQAPKATEAMKITAGDLLELGIADEVLPEPPGGAHTNLLETASTVKEALVRCLSDLRARYGAGRRMDVDRLLADRWERYRKIGVFS